jgi:hypothetical protein
VLQETVHKKFLDHAASIFLKDENILGLAVGGSWAEEEIDAFSDLDLILVTRDIIAGNKEQMLAHASRLGSVLTAFTGEHVGEPRLLICLFESPLLHVDIKFVTSEEAAQRALDPVIVFERDNVLSEIFASTEAKWPFAGYDWFEDRFWKWIHYTAAKLGRGEYLETLDAISFIRSHVIGPMLAQKYGKKPRGVRKIETYLSSEDRRKLESTVTGLDPQDLLRATMETALLYRDLRAQLYPDDENWKSNAEHAAMNYLEMIGNSLSS